ncbi:MAG: tyrosine-type recombinase/integrase [Candidatus Marinimicrobia bacterium]|nr:tyrosine-type recombinase/integrase [Candidatus Neomarinimicrobiota bacterium]
MRLALKKHEDGRLRPQWYGHANVGGRERVFTLCEIKGTPPASLRVGDEGDAKFEHSRARALAMLQSAVADKRSEADEVASLERVHAAKYGAQIEQVPLDDLFARWVDLPRRKKLSEGHIKAVGHWIGEFVAYCREHQPRAKTLDAVSAKTVKGYLKARAESGITPKTWNEVLGVLKLVYGKWAAYAPGAVALKEIVRLEDNPQHRVPYKPEELETIFAVAQELDPDIYPLIVCAALTGMRKKDVCLLRWEAVDLDNGFIRVQTAKTGIWVEIPIFPRFMHVLRQAQAVRREGNSYVWPEMAQLYSKQSYKLDSRLKSILRAAGFVDPAEAPSEGQTLAPQLAPKEILLRALKAVQKAPGWSTKRRGHAQACVETYLQGASVNETAAKLGLSKGSVSGHLKEVAALAGCPIIRQAGQPLPGEIKGHTIAPNDPKSPRKKRASLRGWHSFRTTWITLALSSGVPLSTVQMVSGHTTTAVVLKHYYRPDRENLRAQLQGALPPSLTGETPLAIKPPTKKKPRARKPARAVG